MSLRTAGLLLLFLSLGAVQAKADSVYEVIGTLTVPGNSSNPGVGETINYSFELDYVQPGGTYGDAYVYAEVIGTPTITAFGPLGTAFYTPGGSLGLAADYIPFFLDVAPSGGGLGLPVEIDLDGQFWPFSAGETAPPPPTVTSSLLFNCDATQIAACSDFTVPESLGCLGSYGPFPCGTATAAVYLVPTPEPSPGLLTLTGIALLGLLRVAKIKRTTLVANAQPGA